jgi:methyl-accepting chemotaxis protein
VAGKDLIADILPPPAYIVESYAVVLEMRKQQGSELSESKKRLIQLKNDYAERYGYWQSNALPSALKAALEHSSLPAQSFFDVALGEYGNALDSGDESRADAVLDKLKKH